MLGILGAMKGEVGLLRDSLQQPTMIDLPGRSYTTGRLGDEEVVVAFSGFGKVAAASTVATMVDRFNAGVVLFAGVAGGLGPRVERGDVVVAEELAQHDFDASPIFPRFVIPSLHTIRIRTDPAWTERLVAAATAAGATTHRGLVLSGDRFINTQAERAKLRADFPDALAVEMEGAAVAQVCAERNVPFAVIRAISDTADEAATTDFVDYVGRVAAPLLAAIVTAVLDR